MRARLASDFERFKRELPRDFPAHVREVYGVDLSARYLGQAIPHPIGKGSGQLKKRVLRFLDQKDVKALYHRVEKDSQNWGRLFVHFRWK